MRRDSLKNHKITIKKSDLLRQQTTVRARNHSIYVRSQIETYTNLRARHALTKKLSIKPTNTQAHTTRTLKAKETTHTHNPS